MGGASDEFRANTKIRNVIHTNINSEHFEGHGAVMKKNVCSWFIDNFTKKGDVVMDCFSGMGTTALCCEELGRRYIGFEIVKEYWERSIKRIENGAAQLRFEF